MPALGALSVLKVFIVFRLVALLGLACMGSELSSMLSDVRAGESVCVGDMVNISSTAIL